MLFFKRKNKRSRFQLFLDKLPFRRKESFQSRHALQFHNMTQFGGALNDNIFKYLIVFMLIDLLGEQHSNQILFRVGIVYVLPFLLFSNMAGVLADRLSKQRIILGLKVSELVIILLSFGAFAFKSEWAVYTLMFLLSLQSALFSPPKYSIIPELVKRDKISRANGLITAFTYLAIILGTFTATVVTQLTHRNFVLSAGVCLLAALFGLITAFLSPTLIRREPNKKSLPSLFEKFIER